MEIKKVIEQLEGLKCHCDSMINSELETCEDWANDSEALEIAINILKATGETNMQLDMGKIQVVQLNSL